MPRCYLGRQNYTNNLLSFDFTEQDIADGGSDRLIDTIIPHGSAEQIAAAAQEHLDAGADHVCLQTVGVPADRLRGDERLVVGVDLAPVGLLDQ